VAVAYTAAVLATVLLVLAAAAVLVLRSPTPEEPSLSGLSLAPQAPLLAPGGMESVTAIADYDDGSHEDVSGAAAWASTDPGVATVDAGQLTAVGLGTATVTATFDGRKASTVVTVSNVEVTLSSIAVEPSRVPMLVGDGARVTATATYSDGSTRDVTTTVTWSSGDPAVATVDADGLVTATGAGETTVAARLEDSFDGSVVRVAEPVPPIVRLALSAPTTELCKASGTSAQVTLRGYRQDGEVVDDLADVTWTSDNPQLIDVSPTGLVTLTHADVGRALITAEVQGVRRSLQFTCDPVQ
jgi:uncharacterized protein YjdB